MQKSLTRAIASAALALYGLAMIGCGASLTPRSGAASTSAVSVQPRPAAAAVGEMSGQLAEDYKTVVALTKAANVILVADVVDATSAPYGNLPFTKVTVRPVTVLKGAASGNLTVLETGGT